MKKGANLKIIKLEKGPLQRFKNQNLLLKKFGEVGLQVYRVITGKRTTEELRTDLDMDPDLFTAIISYMEEAGMVELKPIETGPPEIEEEEEEAKVEELKKEKPELKEEPREAEETFTEFEKELEEKEEKLEGEEEKSKKPEEITEEIEEVSEEIEPIGLEEISEEPTERKEEKTEAESGEELKEEETEKEESIEPEKGIELGGPEEGITFEEGEEKEETLSPVEKIIHEKYGEVGLKVYELIDGQRNTDEIMRETGLTESKLLEMLNFMEEQGIIKLEYPGGKKSKETLSEKGETFSQPSIEKDLGSPMSDRLGESFKEHSPVLLPLHAPSSFLRDVKLKGEIILKFGEKGLKVLDLIDGKNDIIDLVVKTTYPLYEVEAVLNFLSKKKAIFIKPLSRTEVRKKYGDEGYNVYKRYGKEGLMLYELMGKELTLKQMVERVTKDKDKAVEMFLFIHQVLKIDLPIDKDIIYKQLE